MTERFGQNDTDGDADVEKIMALPGESQVALIKALLLIADGDETGNSDFPMDLFSEPSEPEDVPSNGQTPTPTVIYTAQPENNWDPLLYSYADGRQTPNSGYVSVETDHSDMTPTPRISYSSKAYKRYPFDGDVFVPATVDGIETAVLLCLGRENSPVRDLPPVEPVVEPVRERDFVPLEIDFGNTFCVADKIGEGRIPVGNIPPLEINLEDLGPSNP